MLPPVAARQLPERIQSQRVGIAEIDPAHGTLRHHGAQLAGQLMADAQWVSPIDQIVPQRVNDTAVAEVFAQQQGTAVAGGTLTAHYQRG